jgi:hypothetical protein
MIKWNLTGRYWFLATVLNAVGGRSWSALCILIKGDRSYPVWKTTPSGTRPNPLTPLSSPRRSMLNLRIVAGRPPAG